jgi:hypothetical protein
MIRHGEPPYLECSSAGDRRFSAFYARVRGQTIEARYQAAKVFRNGDTGLSIKEAKGFRPVNVREVTALYAALWDEYMDENPHLLPIIRAASGLSDRFGRPGSVCQATELWRIRNEP